MAAEHFDVVIVGAGLSGIGAAHHLTKRSSGKSFVLLEARQSMGGTWDLFRYPGIRSDSDMYTLGYSFKPWTNAKAIADGPSILSYIKETAVEDGTESHIRYGHRVRHASWSSDTAQWTVDVDLEEGGTTQFTADFVMFCSGYYRYDKGHQPDFVGQENYKGTIVYPQHWPEGLDYAGKQVVVIGSGATAVTIVPVMAETAAQVTMLQRSPTYMVSRPSQDKIANGLRSVLPGKVAYGITRWKNVLMGMFFYRLARSRPDKVKERMISMVRDHLGSDYDVETHFTPHYNPWDQRVCLVPDADMFDAIKAGSVEVVTDTIDRFEADGIRLTSGKQLPADITVVATGLELVPLGSATLDVDGAPVNIAELYNYKGAMLSGVPNLTITFGYTNASWTLKADLTSEYVCRLINYMDQHHYVAAIPEVDKTKVAAEPFLDFSSGYVQRALAKFPKQGSERPWKLYQNYALDIVTLRHGKIDDGAMRFVKRGVEARSA